MNVAPPPGSLRPEPPARAAARRRDAGSRSRRGRPRALLRRIADILLGKALTLVLAALAFARRPRHLHHPGARRAVRPAAGRRRRPGAGQPVGGAAAGRGAGRTADPGLGRAPPRLRRLAAARAAGAAVRRRRGGARPSWSPASPSPSSISASRPGSTIRCARRSPSRCRSRAAIWTSTATTSARSRWRWRTT